MRFFRSRTNSGPWPQRCQHFARDSRARSHPDLCTQLADRMELIPDAHIQEVAQSHLNKVETQKKEIVDVFVRICKYD